MTKSPLRLRVTVCVYYGFPFWELCNPNVSNLRIEEVEALETTTPPQCSEIISDSSEEIGSTCRFVLHTLNPDDVEFMDDFDNYLDEEWEDETEGFVGGPGEGSNEQEFEDDEFKWGLKAGYDEWVQSAHDERLAVLDALVDAKHLRWVDTLAARDAAAANFTAVATLEAATRALVTAPILEWAAADAGVGWLGDDATGAHRALLGAWVDRLCDVYQATSSGDSAKAWLQGSRTPPFNYLRVHAGVRQILATVKELLDEEMEAVGSHVIELTPTENIFYDDEISPFIMMLSGKIDYYLTYAQYT